MTQLINANENTNGMQIFENSEFGKIRVVEHNNKPYFIAKDVAEILGYALAEKMTRRLNKEEKAIIMFQDIKSDQKRKQIIITEIGLYKCIINSQKINTDKKESLIKFIQENGFLQNIFIFSRKEVEFISNLEEVLYELNITDGIKQYIIENYKINYYIPSLKLAIEYDENEHLYYNKENEINRENIIKNNLQCEIIRLFDKNNNYKNIGIIVKYILNLKVNKQS